jgi:hypothetical protein
MQWGKLEHAHKLALSPITSSTSYQDISATMLGIATLYYTAQQRQQAALLPHELAAWAGAAGAATSTTMTHATGKGDFIGPTMTQVACCLLALHMLGVKTPALAVEALHLVFGVKYSIACYGWTGNPTQIVLPLSMLMYMASLHVSTTTAPSTANLPARGSGICGILQRFRVHVENGYVNNLPWALPEWPMALSLLSAALPQLLGCSPVPVLDGSSSSTSSTYPAVQPPEYEVQHELLRFISLGLHKHHLEHIPQPHLLSVCSSLVAALQWAAAVKQGMPQQSASEFVTDKAWVEVGEQVAHGLKVQLQRRAIEDDITAQLCGSSGIGAGASGDTTASGSSAATQQQLAALAAACNAALSVLENSVAAKRKGV